MMEEQEMVLAGGRVIDPSRQLDRQMDIGIRNGIIVAPEELLNPKRVDVHGKIVAPGFIDVHVHLRDPGQTEKEDVETGTAAAKAGGFTTIVAMPNTVPAMDSPERIHEFMTRIAKLANVRVLPAGALTVGRHGTEMTQTLELVKAGCPVLSDDGSTPQSAGLMRKIMMAAKEAGVPVVDHCEDTSLSKPGVMNDGVVSAELGLPGQPKSAEECIVARDLLLARETGCHIHLQHVSSKGSVMMIRQAKKNGVMVTAEVTPHHLCLTEEACRTYGTMAKMAPPLRTEEDRQALVDAVFDGTIDMIATDHAPHTEAEKAKGWTEAPFGIIGLETAVPLCLNELVHRDGLPLMRFVELFTSGPMKLLRPFCQRFGVNWGTLKIGSAADVTIIDVNEKWKIDIRSLMSKSTNCPYHLMDVKGKVVPLP